MATIRRNGNLIVLKGGRVSCTCCGEGCCMYPAQALYDGIYTVDDLPDTLLVRNGIFGEGLQPAVVLFTKTGTSPDLYTGENFYDGVNHYYTIKLQTVDWQTGESVSPYWASFTEGDNFPYALNLNPGCLIYREDDEADWSEDQFADNYIISGFEVAPRTVTRVSLCEWRSVDECGNISSLLYTGDPPGGSDPPGWFVDVPNYIEPCVVFDVRQGGKIGSANTPVGLYDDLLEVS